MRARLIATALSLFTVAAAGQPGAAAGEARLLEELDPYASYLDGDA